VKKLLGRGKLDARREDTEENDLHQPLEEKSRKKPRGKLIIDRHHGLSRPNKRGETGIRVASTEKIN